MRHKVLSARTGHSALGTKHQMIQEVDHEELKSVVCTLALEDIKGRSLRENTKSCEGSSEGKQKFGWIKRTLPINGDLIRDRLHVFWN